MKNSSSSSSDIIKIYLIYFVVRIAVLRT